MNIKQIRELAEIVRLNGLTALEVAEGETSIRLERAVGDDAHIVPCPDIPQTPPQAPVVVMPASADGGVDFNKLTEVKSSLIGVFYASPAPDAPPFVAVGSKVNKGDVLCIIEAMKLMNEIVAEQAGEVVDVCVGNGDVVEFGQTLFKLC